MNITKKRLEFCVVLRKERKKTWRVNTKNETRNSSSVNDGKGGFCKMKRGRASVTSDEKRIHEWHIERHYTYRF